MKDIHHIYHNNYGIAFQWKRDIQREGLRKIQLIFRDTGFYLNPEEIQFFLELVKNSKQMYSCEKCETDKNCKNMLLSTPSKQIDLAVSKNELSMIEDLLKGTLFQINLNSFLNKICTE